MRLYKSANSFVPQKGRCSSGPFSISGEMPHQALKNVPLVDLMWFVRRMQKFSWTDEVSNERVLAIVNEKCELLQTIKKGKWPFSGHVVRRSSIENLSLTGKVKGKRARGRQRMTYLSNGKDWANTRNGSALIHSCWSRQKSLETHDCRPPHA